MENDNSKVESKELGRFSNTSAANDVESTADVRPTAGVWGMFVEFSGNSSVHGVQYLGEKRRHWIERVFWVIALIISVIVCSITINKIYKKWQLSPVIVSLPENTAPVWKIPFPAVTICPETKALKSYIDITKGYSAISLDDTGDFTIDTVNLTIDELRNLEAVAQICDLHLFKGVYIDSGLKEKEFVPLLKTITMSLNDTTLFCKWRNNILPCSDIFTEILTEEGFCYTFNMLDASELFREEVLADDINYPKHNILSNGWSLENGYSTVNPKAYPRRALGSGSSAGLAIVLKLTEHDLDYICRGPVQGFKIFLHTPGEIPRTSKQYFRVPLRQDVVVSVKANMMTTSEGLADYDPESRQCYFNDERNLKFFKVYTQSHCELECLANFTLKKCGCVKFSMPRDLNTRICAQFETQCCVAAQEDLTIIDITQRLESDSDVNKFGKSACNCLPSCSSISYDAEISQADYEFGKVFNAYDSDPNEFPDALLARLTIFFKESQFMTSRRSELYGLSDFLANCGGLLGLFMGVSILSIIEIFYYITLRLCCDFNLRRQKQN